MSAAGPLEFDVAIVGGGWWAQVSPLALRGSGRRVLLVESVPFAAAGAAELR